MRCSGTKRDGSRCRAALIPGRDVCRWHSTDPADREKHLAESKRGGYARAYGQLVTVAPLGEAEEFAELRPRLATAAGVRDFISLALAQLAQLPFDCKVANAIAQLATAQRGIIDTSDIEERLRIIEEQQLPGPKRA